MCLIIDEKCVGGTSGIFGMFHSRFLLIYLRIYPTDINYMKPHQYLRGSELWLIDNGIITPVLKTWHLNSRNHFIPTDWNNSHSHYEDEPAFSMGSCQFLEVIKHNYVIGYSRRAPNCSSKSRTAFKIASLTWNPVYWKLTQFSKCQSLCSQRDTPSMHQREISTGLGNHKVCRYTGGNSLGEESIPKPSNENWACSVETECWLIVGDGRWGKGILYVTKIW